MTSGRPLCLPLLPHHELEHYPRLIYITSTIVLIWVQSGLHYLFTSVSGLLFELRSTGYHFLTSVSSLPFKLHSAWRNLTTNIISKLTKTPSLITHWAIHSRYHLTLFGLTIWAYLTNKSFVIHHPSPERLPHLIARSTNTDLHAFNLTSRDYNGIFWNDLQNIGLPSNRKWRPVSWVNSFGPEITLMEAS